MSHNQLVIIRGLPGSGKSTLARELYVARGFSHWEADMFFEGDEGYRFNPRALPTAHAWCRTNVRRDLAIGRDVVVANTFVERWQYESYVTLANHWGIPYLIVTCIGDFKNIHGVPRHVVDGMRSRWQSTEEHEPQQTVFNKDRGHYNEHKGIRELHGVRFNIEGTRTGRFPGGAGNAGHPGG